MTEEKSGQGTIPVSHAASRTLFTPSTALKGMQSFHLLLYAWYAWGVWSLLSSELLLPSAAQGGTQLAKIANSRLTHTTVTTSAPAAGRFRT